MTKADASFRILKIWEKHPYALTGKDYWELLALAKWLK